MTNGEILRCFYSLSLWHLEFNKNGHNHSPGLIIRSTVCSRSANGVTKWQRGTGAVSDTRWLFIPFSNLTLKHDNNFVTAVDQEQLITPFKVHRYETNNFRGLKFIFTSKMFYKNYFNF
jgi:hypothetical protein